MTRDAAWTLFRNAYETLGYDDAVDITENTVVDNIIDSLDMIEMIMFIEDEMNVEIDFADQDGLQDKISNGLTVGQLVDYFMTVK